MEARHETEPAEILIGNTVVICNRGECVKSLETWSKRWGWTKSATRRFFILLKNMGNIDTESVTVTTRIKLINYDTYCPLRNADETQVKRKRNASETQVAPNNNDKNVNNEKNKDILSSAKANGRPPYKEIVDYLNLKASKNFNPTTKVTQQHIKARWNEGFRLDDFKRVIDVKTGQWLSNAEMNPYLRPQTLFNTKFEAYLNETGKTAKEANDDKWARFCEKFADD